MKAAAVVEERRCVRIAAAVDYLTHEAGVVAHHNDLTNAAVEPGRGVGQDRRREIASQQIDAREPGPTAGASRVREAPRQPMIGLTEQIGGETAALHEA